MNVANMAGAAMDSIGSGVQKKVQKKIGSEIAKGVAAGTLDSANGKAFSKFSKGLAGAVGGGAEGLITGAAGGAVVGGVVGGIDQDQTFLEGAAKGALIGGGVGGLGGAVSGALHGNGQLVINSINDVTTATSKLSGLGHDGINLAGKWRNQAHEAAMSSIYNPKVMGVL